MANLGDILQFDFVRSASAANYDNLNGLEIKLWTMSDIHTKFFLKITRSKQMLIFYRPTTCIVSVEHSILHKPANFLKLSLTVAKQIRRQYFRWHQIYWSTCFLIHVLFFLFITCHLTSLFSTQYYSSSSTLLISCNRFKCRSSFLLISCSVSAFRPYGFLFFSCLPNASSAASFIHLLSNFPNLKKIF